MPRFVPGVIDYNGVMATNYPAGRALSARATETWRLAITPFIPSTRNLTIVDLGSGTGRFASLLATRFSARVIGVEPAHGMRSIAMRESHPDAVAFVAGIAEKIPLRDACVDVVWLSQVLHHIRDLPVAAAELRRILREPGVVLIRGVLADGESGFPTLLHYFPGVRRVFKELPTIEDTVRTFGSQHLRLSERLRIQQQTCGSLKELADRTRLRADTSLTLLSDDEFAECQRGIEEAAEREFQPEPVIETLDLLVFRRA
jgi:ubiquinone/menaquinone biosynthesis C-methylase UbiE